MTTKINYPIDETLTDVTEKRCPILHAMNILGSKWKLPIIWYLHEKENTPLTNLNAASRVLLNLCLQNLCGNLKATA